MEKPRTSALVMFKESSKPAVSFANLLIENSYVPAVDSPAPRLSKIVME
jgi:hypothetical protein